MCDKRPYTIFCDIDGTLWNHVGEVSKQMKAGKEEFGHIIKLIIII